ncbi:hypothetical protein DFH08DRAFT_838285 [Mycena albidolilacea]|uniref:SHSP domain-containing protein n=1 Tax=Mycena albidolilacea TaxID=1033008 RepID=A0AAD7ANU5_9AGAR|nr:hypothetical protein DFH08DRAFT_838285 [Mycena albidolilacea]
MVSRPSGSKPISRRITSPITPATTAGVTGIVFPFPPESSTSESPSIVRPRPLRRVSRIDTPASKRDLIEISSNVSVSQVEDAAALDDLWNSLRAQKELKMAKEHPKVKSLGEHKPTLVLNTVPKSSPSPRPPSRLTISNAPRPVPESPPSTTAPSARTRDRRSLLEDVVDRASRDRDSFFRTPSPILPNVPRTEASSPAPAKTPSPKPKKKKSITLFRTLPEKNYSIAIFDLRGVDKDDIRVTFKRDHIIVSWEKWEVENWEEEDCIARLTVERVYHRIIPLAEGTKYQDIYCAMKAEDLLLRYPLVGLNGSRSVES